jgi:hypothetical protein
MSFAIGSLVRARGREWVVRLESEVDVIVLRPLGLVVQLAHEFRRNRLTLLVLKLVVACCHVIW